MSLCPLQRASFPEDRCTIWSFTLVYYVTALQILLLYDLTAVFSCQRRKKFLCYDTKRCHFCIPVVFPRCTSLSQSEGMCIFRQSWKWICLNQPLDWACIHSLVLTHPPTQRLTKFWPDCIQLTWISHFLAKQFPSQTRWPLPHGNILSVMP